ncbi:L,D-transpeptidase family protein [Pseudochrobactrum kiredjianiae]|uniref:L,D-TPase catalytic domain-containing protein n=1 Tax=Pseudochrobactrum kiredjianiae TaxID=386305 RepID=A0ABW3V573_9HYPH|nr:murein L,D-transpeptidase family protein [Pseudochrobactrum kiredjianiae]MDM7849537.1 murein L,D-transpeptidase family protein [Pseudochrobactrum kiredjianiae]
MKLRTAIFASLIATVALAGCQGSVFDGVGAKAERELPSKVQAKIKAKGMNKTSPVMARIFKEEGVLEVWKQKTNGRYDMVASYEICKWSGKLGPKFVEGDRQAPEGFYSVSAAQMNPNSQFYLSFNLGFPNAYDRAHGRTGQHLMVHGACSSAGCYSMTDESMSEIYAFGRDAFKGGQRDFQVQAFPFRMTAANMARYKSDPNYEFWAMLKEGYDQFEITKVPPKVDVCGKRYVFNQNFPGQQGISASAACPPMSQPDSIQSAYSSYQKTYDAAFSTAINKSSKKNLAPSIMGIQEAKLVSDWSARRARGEKVSRTPPSLSPASSETPGSPDTAAPTAIAQTPAPAAATTVATSAAVTAQPELDQNVTASVPVPASNPVAAETTPQAVPVVPSPEKKSLWNRMTGQ